jgi:uncharacterized Zn-binding protein involved in type VI secretion
MAGKAALRVGDPVQCVCSCKKCKPCPNGRIVTGSSTTFVNNKPVARAGDTTSNCCGCCCPCPNKILRGSTTCFVDGRGVARVGDPIRCGIATRGSTDTFYG